MTAFTTTLDLGSHPVLERARQRAVAVLAAATRALAAGAAALADVETVVAAGSLGRLEVHDASDIDCIVVTRDGVSAAARQTAVRTVYDCLSCVPLAPPKAEGIYREAVERGALLDRAQRGNLAETPAVFGKRMQFLLDARPLFAAERATDLTARILDWYADDFIAREPGRSWSFLINDLTRYLHSYAAWQQFKFTASSDDSWHLRQAKLRTSRVVTIAALLFLLGESDRRRDKRAWLAPYLDLTPLERLACVMSTYDAAAFRAVLDEYAAAFARLTEPSTRLALIASTDPACAGPPALPELAALEAHGRAVHERLTAFALERQRDWGTRFFSRWLL